MKSTLFLCALLLCATAAVAAHMLPAGSYAQHDEGGEHTSTSSVGGFVVNFDDQWFVWNGSCYMNGLSTLEIYDLGDGEYAWLLFCPDRWDTGVMTAAGAGTAPVAVPKGDAAGPRTAPAGRRG